MRYVSPFLAWLLPRLPKRLSVAGFAMISYRRSFGRFPNILSPRRFSEKVQRAKIFDHNPLMPLLADKIEAKHYARAVLGDAWLIPNLWQGRDLPPVASRDWPLPFVIKTTHASGWNIFVRNQAERDWPAIERQLADWLGRSYGSLAGEWLYARIPPRILIEPFMGAVEQLPIDYKCWVFRGVVRLIQVDFERGLFHKRNFYTPDWQQLPFTMGFPLGPEDATRPASLADMIEAAALLAKDFAFARVDFYEIAGRPKFGEITFYPDSGREACNPDAYDFILGSYWR